MNDSNRTTKESLPSSDTLAIVQVTFYTAITIFGTIANLALCGTMIRKKQPRNASEYLIFNLAFTDLMTCAVGIPLDVAVILFQRWPFGAFMCKVVWPFQTVLIAVSVGTLTCMAIERYRAILTPFKTMLSQNVVKIVICAVWCSSVALVAPYIVILEHKDGVCRESWHNEYHPKMFTVSVFLLFYATPLGVIAPAYACIGCSLHSDDRRMRKFSQQQGPGNRQFQALVRKRSRSNVVIVKTFLFGAVAFAICLLPYHVMWLWHDFGQGGRWTHFEDTLVFANALVYFNSLVNPFILGGTVAFNWRKSCTAMFAKIMIRWSQNSLQRTHYFRTRKQNDPKTLLQQQSARSLSFVQYSSSV